MIKQISEAYLEADLKDYVQSIEELQQAKRDRSQAKSREEQAEKTKEQACKKLSKYVGGNIPVRNVIIGGNLVRIKWEPELNLEHGIVVTIENLEVENTVASAYRALSK